MPWRHRNSAAEVLETPEAAASLSPDVPSASD